MDALTIRAALLLGFSLILGLWGWSGSYLIWRVGEVQRAAEGINARYMRSQELLSTARADVLLGSVYVRDAVLDPNPLLTETYRRQVDDIFQRVDAALRTYEPVFDPTVERDHVNRLRAEMQDMRTSSLAILAGDNPDGAANARTLLRTRIVPRRDGVLRLSEEVQALNRTAYAQQQAATAAVYASTQRRVVGQFAVALIASLGIAWLALGVIARLEGRLVRQIAANADTSRELQRLSARLITAQEEERRAIGRELHDQVGQMLTALKVELAFAEREARMGDPAPGLARARGIAERTLATVRSLSRLVHPGLLDDLGLVPAVQALRKEVCAHDAIRVEVVSDGVEGSRLPGEVEVTGYRVIQEALTNVARHASASTCRVYLQRLASAVLVTVEDDGMGFDVGAAQRDRRGLGLVSMRERAALVGGTLRIESAPGRGTRITLELPLPVAAPVAV